jgi:hypothetical protein
MSHSKDRIEQGTKSKTVPRRTLTALGTTTALALLGITLIFLFLFLLFWMTAGQVVLPVLAVVLVFAFTAAFVATGVRWASVLGSLVALAAMIFLFVLPLGGSALRHPTANVARFSELVLVYALAVIALVTGIAAAIQNYRSTERFAPRWSRRAGSCCWWMMMRSNTSSRMDPGPKMPHHNRGRSQEHQLFVIGISRGDLLPSGRLQPLASFTSTVRSTAA